jgi:hypothetical protein
MGYKRMMEHRGAESIQNCTYQTNSDHLRHDVNSFLAQILVNSFIMINFLNMFIVLTLKFKRGN